MNLVSKKDPNKILFTFHELMCKGTGKMELAPGFANKLIELRETWDKPMIVNSCCRSFVHNAKIGGNPKSLHVYDTPFWPTGGTCAIDIAMKDSIQRAALVKLALEMGWWVGINATFVHLDRRIDFGIADRPGIFLY